MLFALVFLLSTGNSLADELDDAWADRHSEAKAKKLLEVGEKLAKENPDSYDVHWKLSRAYYFYGSYFVTENEEQKTVFLKAKDAAGRAIALNKNGVEGYYWYAVGIGKWGEANGVMKSLSQVKPMQQALEKVIKLDPNYDDGGGYRVLGRLYFRAPSVISIGDNDKSIENLKKAMKKNPRHKLTLFFLAETLMGEGEYAEALEVLARAEAYPIVKERETEEKSWLNDIKKDIEICNKKL
ncbi:MAG: hypothetical protein FJ088_09625 [Deltaproteobacteria bacterium]|nr:hypothetical protein [Deltaproteobacteria bacterium]